MKHRNILTLIVPVNLEEVLVDWLLENAPEQGFCSFPVNGHSASHAGLSQREQVSGRRRQIRFDIHLASESSNALLERFRLQFAGIGIEYYLSTLMDAGEI